jgi:hypothetical protein
MQSLEQGDEVVIRDLSNLNARYNSITRWIYDSLLYKKSAIKAIKKLAIFHSLDFTKTPPLAFQRSMSSYEVDNSLFEGIVRSNFATEFGKKNFDLLEMPLNQLKDTKKSFYSSFAIAIEILNEIKPDLLVTVNGRFIVDGALLVATQQLNLEYRVLETTSESNEYYSILQISSQSFFEIQSQINEVWNQRGATELENSGGILNKKLEIWFLKKRSNIVSTQLDSSLKSGFATFFPTSDFEFSILDFGRLEKGDFEDQVEAFKHFVNFSNNLGLGVKVRVHPHSSESNLSIIEDEIWRKLCQEYDAEFISSRSHVNSYILASQSDLCAVYNSTIGAEIAWLGLPVVILGPTAYSHLIPELTAFNISDLLEKKSSDFILGDRTKLFPWAYYMSTGQTKLRYVKLESADSIYFQGTSISQERYLFQLLRKYKKRFKLIYRHFNAIH